MSDRVLRQLVTVLSALAIIAVVLDVPSLFRVPTVLGFAMLAPGLAVTRFVPTITGVDQFAVGAATSIAANILLSMLLVAAGRWSGEPVLACLVAVTLTLAFLPMQSPWRRRQEHVERSRDAETRSRRMAQSLVYDQVLSSDPSERRSGLMALSWLLVDDNRPSEAARMRALSRLPDPPRLPLREPDAMTDTWLRGAHQQARSEDPETRRQGLFDVAELLDMADRQEEAATLRELASGDQVPEL